MARVKYDVKGVESGDRPVLPAGVYTGKITQADVTKPEGKDQRIELVVTVKHDGTDYQLYEYVNLVSKSAAWKLRELLEAVEMVSGNKGESGTLDTDKMLLGKSIGVKTFIRPADDARGFDEQARIRRMFAAADDGGEDLDDDTDGEDLDGEDDGTTEYDDMTLAQLRKEAKDRGLKVLRKHKADDIIDMLVEDDEEGGDDEEPPEDDDDPGDAEDEYDEMSLADLRKAARGKGIKTAGMKQPAIIDALREADQEESGDDEPGEGEEEPPDDYDEWSDEDLRTELKDRSLGTRGSKRVLIGRLRKDDAEGDEPF